MVINIIGDKKKIYRSEKYEVPLWSDG